jgi:hypothetical protein
VKKPVKAHANGSSRRPLGETEAKLPRVGARRLTESDDRARTIRLWRRWGRRPDADGHIDRPAGDARAPERRAGEVQLVKDRAGRRVSRDERPLRTDAVQNTVGDGHRAEVERARVSRRPEL